MTNPPMTPDQGCLDLSTLLLRWQFLDDQEFDFYAQPENQEPQGPARRGTTPGSARPCRYASLRNCWSRHAGRPTPTTGRYLHGSAALSNTNSAGPPDARDAVLPTGAERTTFVVIVYTAANACVGRYCRNLEGQRRSMPSMNAC